MLYHIKKLSIFSLVASFVLTLTLSATNALAAENGVKGGKTVDKQSTSWMYLAKGQRYVPPQKKDGTC